MANQKLDVVKTKFSAFVKEAENLRLELTHAQNQVAKMQHQLSEKEVEVAQLHSQLKERKIADAVVGNNSIETDQAKQKITELMREIDRCIALLNV